MESNSKSSVLTRTHAASIAGVSPQAISDAVNAGKINRYLPDNMDCARLNGMYIKNDSSFEDYCETIRQKKILG